MGLFVGGVILELYIHQVYFGIIFRTGYGHPEPLWLFQGRVWHKVGAWELRNIQEINIKWAFHE